MQKLSALSVVMAAQVTFLIVGTKVWACILKYFAAEFVIRIEQLIFMLVHGITQIMVETRLGRPGRLGHNLSRSGGCDQDPALDHAR